MIWRTDDHIIPPVTVEVSGGKQARPGLIAVDIAKQQLRDFIVNSDMARQALSVPASQDKKQDDIDMDTLDSRGKKTAKREEEVDDI